MIPEVSYSLPPLHLGDIISLDAHPLFVLRSARLVGGSSFEDLQDPTIRTQLMEAAKDRCYDHTLFYVMHARGLLPGVAAVEVQLKNGSIMSEFTRYR